MTMASVSRPTGDALLYLATEIESEVENDFNLWCEGHVKDNLSLPGFLGARRLHKQAEFTGVGECPTYLTAYDLESAGAIETEAYANHDTSMPAAFSGRFQFSRMLFRAIGSDPDVAGRQTRGAAILHVTVNVDPAYNDEFLAWYADVHVPAVLSAPGMLSARRYETVGVAADDNPAADGFRYLTLYEMEERDVMSRPETIEASMKGACPARLEPHRWATHHVYEEIFAAES
jgi:hypothetical protein